MSLAWVNLQWTEIFQRKGHFLSQIPVIFFSPQSTAFKVRDEGQREVVIDSLLANRFKVSSSDFKLLQLHVFSLLNDVWLAIIKLFQFLFCFVFS